MPVGARLVPIDLSWQGSHNHHSWIADGFRAGSDPTALDELSDAAAAGGLTVPSPPATPGWPETRVRIPAGPKDESSIWNLAQPESFDTGSLAVRNELRPTGAAGAA